MAKTVFPTLTRAETQKLVAFLESQFGLKLADVAEKVGNLTPREMDVFRELAMGGMGCSIVLALFAKFAITDEPKAPAKVKELFADFDPRKDALDAKVVRWNED